MEHINSGNAAVFVLVNATLAKMYMSFRWRVKGLGKSDKEKKLIFESSEFKTDHAKQLNDAEYSPLLFAGLLYLHSKGSISMISSGLSMLGVVTYLWSNKIGLGAIAPVGAIARFVALFTIANDIRGTF